MIVDLHTHTSCSDGALSPGELIRHAADSGVEMLAITDHDTLAAFEQVEAGTTQCPQLIAGIELSTIWHGVSIHVLGLNVDVDEPALRTGVGQQQQARIERAQRIAQRLGKRGVPCDLDHVLEAAGDAVVGRPHFAQYLVDSGMVPDLRAAYRRYLGAGKAGDVKTAWAPLPEVVAWILAAGGTAVLAHPAKYGMTTSKLRRLLRDFQSVGGEALEVVCGSQPADTTRRLARLATDLGLAASAGSDFHCPGNTWSAPGRFPPLPASLPVVWHSWR